MAIGQSDVMKIRAEAWESPHWRGCRGVPAVSVKVVDSASRRWDCDWQPLSVAINKAAINNRATSHFVSAWD